MKTKKILLGALAVILTIVISITATIAYLTDVDSETNVFTIGNVDIDLLEYERVDTETADGEAVVQEFKDGKPLLPAVIDKDFDYTAGDTYVDWKQDAVKWQQQNDDDGYTSPIWDPAKINNEVDKMVFVKNTGDYSAFVRTYFAFEAGNYATFERFQEMIHINLNDTASEWVWEWTPFVAEIDGGRYFIAKATYQKELAPEAITEISLSQIALDSSATNADVDAFGEDYRVLVSTQGIQTAGFGDPETALDEGFGDGLPFANATIIAGIDLKTALHNLNGNNSQPITANVENVIFGLNEKYPEVVDNYKGTLTSVEQDVPVYTYYVPNATNSANYDVYVLADSAIYTPKDSYRLFENMTALKSVNTSNMDVSRTEDMSSMFVFCEALAELDVSNWNVSNVTSMNSMFYGCNALTHLDVSSWDVGKCAGMKSMFYMCENLGNLNVSGWNVSQVTDMTRMFRGCQTMTSIDLSGWNVQKVVDMSYMFGSEEHSSLTELILTGWETTSLKNMEGMFHSCSSLESIDVSDIDTQNVTNMTKVFRSCLKIEKIIGLEKWETSNVETMVEMFRHCGQSGTYGEYGGNMQVLDLSSFNTSKVTNTIDMFHSCDRLQTIYVGDGWDMSKVTNSSGMFTSCSSLVGGAGTVYSSAHREADYAHVDGGTANPGYFTYKAAPTTNP